MSTVLQVEALTTCFPGEVGPVPIVDGSSLLIRKGEVVALVGESGCGKSMTALSLMRLVPRPGRITAGSVRLLGRELLDLDVAAMRHVRGGEISMIFQEPMTSLNPVVRVGKQVVEAIRLHEDVSRQDAMARCLDLFEKVGIPDARERLRAFPHELSGGLKQRVMIAMALSTRPKLLIADEPTTALDVTIQAQILDLLRQLQRDLGLSILLITHDLGIVNELADRVSVMYAGRIIEAGGRKDILQRAAHPYTQGLLRSMPALTRHGERLPEIPGVVPTPAEWPSGCRFATRCALRFAPCDEQVPGVTRVSEEHEAHCHALASSGHGGAGEGGA